MGGAQPWTHGRNAAETTDGWCNHEGTIKERRRGDPLELYKYNGNLLHLSALSVLEVVACGRDFCRRKVFVCMRRLRICRRKVTCWRIEKVVELQKEKACYSTYTTGTFHVAWVTSKPTSLQDTSYVHENPSHPTRLMLRLWDGRTEASFNPMSRQYQACRTGET